MSKYLKYGLHAAVIIGLVVAGFKYLNGEEIWSAIRSFNYGFLPFMLLASTLYLALKAWRFHILLTPCDDLERTTVMRAYGAGQAATLLPGGVAARAALLKQANVPLEQGSVAVVFSSVSDQVLFIIASLLAAIFYPPVRTAALIILVVLAGATLLLLIPAVRRGLMRASEWIAGKFEKTEVWHEFLNNCAELWNWCLLLRVLGVTLAALSLEVVTLDLAIRGLGQQISYPNLILAYVVPTMLGRLSGLPAGLGVTDGGMVGILGGVAGLGTGTATGAVILFRLATAFFRALLGGVLYAFAWQGEQEDAQEV